MSASSRRALGAGFAILALTTPVALHTAADAAPATSHSHAKAPHAKASHTKQLLKAISVKDAQLGRLATADRTTRLADDNEAAVVANIVADRSSLAALRADAESAGSTLDTDGARKALRDFRVVNYVLSTNILHQAEGMAPADAAAAAHVADAVAAALAITAQSAKSDVRDARALLHLAVEGETDADAADGTEVSSPIV